MTIRSPTFVKTYYTQYYTFSFNYYRPGPLQDSTTGGGQGQGRSQDLVSGGTHFGGGATPYFSPQTPNHKGLPLCTFGFPRASGGRPPPPAPLTTPLKAQFSATEGAKAPKFQNSINQSIYSIPGFWKKQKFPQNHKGPPSVYGTATGYQAWFAPCRHAN